MPRRAQSSDSGTSSLARLVKVYQTIAVLFFNSLVLGILILAILSALFPTEKYVWKLEGGTSVSSSFVPEHYYLSDQEVVEKLGQEYDDFVLQGAWQVHPWTGLINRQYEGEYLNVDQYGRRATSAPSAAHAGQPPLTIWVFGGSTLFGWGLPDQHTLASQLQGELQARIPDRQVRVTNFGVPWYNSSHEAALLVANLREAPEPPDIALFLDGPNDLSHVLAYHNESPLHNQLDAAWESWLDYLYAPFPGIQVSPNFPLFRAYYVLGPGDPLGVKIEKRNPGEVRSDEELVQRALDHYRTNRRVMTAVCQEYDIAPYFLLYATPFWLDRDPGTLELGNSKAFVDDLVENNDNPFFYDITLALADLEPAYSTTVEDKHVGTHFSDMANKVLAGHIADIILETYVVDE